MTRDILHVWEQEADKPILAGASGTVQSWMPFGNDRDGCDAVPGISRGGLMAATGDGCNAVLGIR
jgi:hypothetical protein